MAETATPQQTDDLGFTPAANGDDLGFTAVSATPSSQGPANPYARSVNGAHSMGGEDTRSFADKLTEIIPDDPRDSIGHRAANFVGNIGAAGMGVIRHPIDTATGIAKSLIPGTDTPNPIQSAYQGLNTRPADTIASGIGQAAVMGGAAEATGLGYGAIRGALRDRLIGSPLRGVVKATDARAGALDAAINKTDPNGGPPGGAPPAAPRGGPRTPSQQGLVTGGAGETAWDQVARETREGAGPQVSTDTNTPTKFPQPSSLLGQPRISIFDQPEQTPLPQPSSPLSGQAPAPFEMPAQTRFPRPGQSTPQSFEDILAGLKGPEPEPGIDIHAGPKPVLDTPEPQGKVTLEQEPGGTSTSLLDQIIADHPQRLEALRTEHAASSPGDIKALMDAIDESGHQSAQAGDVELFHEQAAAATGLEQILAEMEARNSAPTPAEQLEMGKAYIQSVLSGIAPVAAAAALHLTPEQQEMAHVAAALMPNAIGAVSQPAPPQPPPVPQQPPPSDAAGLLAQQQQQTVTDFASRATMVRQQAEKIAAGVPPPVKPSVPSPQGMDNGQITQQTVDRTVQAISQLPPALQPKTVLEVVGNLAKRMLGMKTVMGPDGRVVNVDSPKSAQTEAIKIVNGEMDRQQDQAKEKAAAQKEGAKAKAKAMQDQMKQRQKEAETARKDAETAQAERDKALNLGKPSGESAKPIDIPDTHQTRQARQALRAAGPHATSRHLDTAVRGSAMVSAEVRKALVEEEIARRANRQEDSLTAAMNGKPPAPGQSREELQAWATAAGRGEHPYVHVPQGSSFVPTGIEPLTHTKVNGAGKFSGSYYHAPEIDAVEIRKAARDKKDPQAALDALKAKWEEEKDPIGFTAAEPEKPKAETKPAEPETKAPAKETPKEEAHKFKYGNTQVNIPPDSDAAKALDEVRATIPKSDLAGDGKDIDGNHVTVRYGIEGDDTSGIKKFIEQQVPFEATLGPVEKFPASEHSDGAVPLIAPVTAPDLHKLNKEIEKHGDFTEPSFPDYKPHATVAYVTPEAADKYVGDTTTEGATFHVDSIAITDRDGNSETVALKGKPELDDKERATPEVTLAESLQPLSALTLRPTQAWKKDLAKWLKGGEWISDGHAAVSLTAAAGKQGTRAFDKVKPSHSLVFGVGIEAITPTKKTSPAQLLGYTPRETKDGIDKAHLVYGDDKQVTLNAHILKLLLDIVGPDVEFGISTPKDPVIISKAGKTVAIVMPFRTETDLDIPTARRVMATKKPSSQPEPDKAPEPAAPQKGDTVTFTDFAGKEREGTIVEAQPKRVIVKTSSGARMPVPVGKIKTGKAERERAAEAEQLADHFTPGNVILGSYWKKYDKVLEFEPTTKEKGWSVKVIESDKDGNPIPGERPRWHSTNPDKKDVVVKRGESVTAAKEETITPEAISSLADYLYSEINAGRMPKDNIELRKMVAAFDKAPPDQARMKVAQEAIEVAIVRRARDIVELGDKNGVGDPITFDRLVALYDSQPNLNVRTSTSIADQAYSTPAPLAFLAGRLAGLTAETTGHEPTGGNGMLVITGSPSKITTTELNPERAASLRAQGFKVTEGDALKNPAEPKSVDAVLANPPFGSVKENEKPVKVDVDGYKIGQIDHLIAARALEAMKDDGKATLILGASKFTAGGQSEDDRIFLNWLYSHYNVTSHFELDGKLYGRQGAAWPVRVITVSGRVESKRFAPPIGTIQRASSWKEVYGQFSKSLAAQQSGVGQRSPDRPLQRPAADGSKFVPDSARGEAGGVVQPEPQGSAAGTERGPGGKPKPVRNRPGASDKGLASAGNEFGPDADTARSDQLPEGQKPRDKRERVAKPANAAGSDPLLDPDNQFQVNYRPASSKKDVDVLIPTNMRAPLEHAMVVLEDEVGDIDKYVADQLGYESEDELHDAFMGLQVDSIAAAVSQMSKGKAVIIGDQTGIGKGRQAAGIIRWATKQGKIPIFVTRAPELFTDIYGDLADIGTTDVAPLLVNADASITLPNGEKIFTNRSSSHRDLLENVARTRKLPEDRNALFITYSQINKEGNLQQRLLSSLAPNAIFILDESHNAGGDSNTGEYMQSLLANAGGVTYLSATYAKRPDNMPLYFKTDIGMAIGDSNALTDAMQAGGLPLQTVVSHNLVEAGQFFRRERSYDGVDILSKVDTSRGKEHAALADKVTEALRAIVSADHAFHTTTFDQILEQVTKEGKTARKAGNQAERSVTHGEFSSVVHNFVRQMLLGLKADSALQEALEALKRGEKPIIAVDNTMGSFLSAYASDNELQDGDQLKGFDYRTVLSRALNRSRYYIETDQMGNKTRIYVPLEDLDGEARAAYDDAQSIIDNLELDIPVSPIDWIKQGIQNAGYSISEITGRNLAVDYSDPKNPKLSSVTAQEQHDKVETTRQFNDGRLDVILANVAGSTGISLHASSKFKDQRQRHMIVVQPAQDINVFMQMLGRIHRTGQVNLPRYTILNADLPAEKRPTALLSMKMKSLNAQTSSNTESATSVKAVDMLNKYGDEIIGQYLDDNPKLERMLGIEGMDGEHPTEDIARKATGKLAIMPVKLQEAFYNDVEQQYNDHIAYLNSTNQNDLEPRTFDYEAEEKESEVMLKGEDPSSPFGQDAIYGEYSIKSQGKPLTAADVETAMDEHLEGKTSHDHARALIASLDKQFNEFIKGISDDEPALVAAHARADYGRRFIQNNAIGSTLRIEINGDVFSAAVTNIRSTHKGAGNPYSLSKINVALATTGSMRHLSVPATQLDKILVVRLSEKPEYIFGVERPNVREKAKIITGNLLAAYGELSGTKATIINFTKANGEIAQGILLPKKFVLKANTRGDYRLKNPADALYFLKNSKHPDIGLMGIAPRLGGILVRWRNGSLELVTPKAKATGGKYFLDKSLLALTGDFVSTSSTMRVVVPHGKELKAIAEVIKKGGLYAFPSVAEEAASMAGKKQVKAHADPTANVSFMGAAYAEQAMAATGRYALKGAKNVWADLTREARRPGTTGKAMGREFIAAMYPLALASKDALDIMGKALGEPAMRIYEAGQFLHGVKKMFAGMSQAEQVEFVDRWQTGRAQPTPDLESAQEFMRTILELQRDREQEAINLGKKGPERTLGDKANYFPNRYKVAPGREELLTEADQIQNLGQSRRPFEGSKAFMKQQRYTLAEAVADGGVPLGDPVDMLMRRLQEGAKFVSARYAWYNFKDQALAMFLKKGKKLPVGYRYIDDKSASVWRIIQSTETDDEGTHKTYPLESGQWIMHNDAARLLNNYLSSDYIRSSTTLGAVVKLKNFSTECRLAVSGFHWAYITVENLASGINLGLDKFWNQGVRGGWDATKMSGGLADLGKSIVAPYTAIKQGGQMIQYARNPDEFVASPEGAKFVERYPDFIHLQQLLFKGGLRWNIAENFRASFGDHCIQNWKDAEIGKGMVKLLPWLSHVIMAPLFEHYIPRSKWVFAVQMLSQKLAQNSQAIAMGYKTEEEIAREVAETTDNRFGELNWDSLYLNNNLRTAMQFFFRSASWKLGSWRGLVAAGKEQFTSKAFDDHMLEKLIAEGRDLNWAQKYATKLPQAGMNALWLVSMGLFVGTMGSVISKTQAYKYPWEWAKESTNGLSYVANVALESMHPRITDEFDEHGAPIRMSFPTGLKDYEHAYEHPGRYLVSSEADISVNAWRSLANMDTFDNYVYDPNDQVYSKLGQGLLYNIEGDFSPMTVSNWKQPFGKQDIKSKLARATGMMGGAPKRLDRSAALTLAMAMQRHEAHTPKQQQEWEYAKSVPKVGRALRLAERQEGESYFAKLVTKMSYPDALKILDVATPKEKAEIADIMDIKERNYERNQSRQ